MSAPEDLRDGAEEIALVDRHIEQLMEHFEHVQIFVGKCEDDPTDPKERITAYFTRGGGNSHARHGQIREWLIRHEEGFRIYERRKAEEQR